MAIAFNGSFGAGSQVGRLLFFVEVRDASPGA